MSRTAIAAALIAAGIAVPCTAWYVAGSRAARDEAERIEAAPLEQARLEAEHLARQIALRLESLREVESRRPFQDYLAADAPPMTVCADVPGRSSPLAQGPADPLIWAHFQIDNVGVLSLPTLGGGAPGPSSGAGGPALDALQQAIYDELECASSYHLAALRRRPDDTPAARRAGTPGVVTVGPFTWHTIAIESAPALVALREVVVPSAVLTQGFVVPASRLASLLSGAILPAELRPGAPGGAGEALVPLQGDAWSVRVDAASASAAAAAAARPLGRRFRARFLAGALAATLAGAALVLLVRQSERAAAERARFAAAAAHELRTPLAGLQLYGEMLADGLGDPERRQVHARRIADEAQRLGRVVSNVLGFSHLERGSLGVSASSGDLAAAVRTSIERLAPAIEGGGASIELSADPALPHARFDADAVHQILQNLLDNAEKFARGARDRRIEVRLELDGGAPALTVRDHGPGVEPALARRLFRPFAAPPGAATSRGLGIGLALSRALAEAQGATLSHERPVDGGAAFRVRFRADPGC